MPTFDSKKLKPPFEASIDLLKQAYQDAPVGLCLFDSELRYLFINDWLAKINDKEVSQHLGRFVSEILPQLEDEIVPLLRGVLETGKPLIKGVIERASPNRPGGKLVLQQDYHPLIENNKIVGVSCVIRNITKEHLAESLQAEIEERKLVEQRLRTNEKQFRDLLEASPDATIYSELSGAIQIVNAQALKLFGYTRDELIGKSIEILIPDRLRDIHISHRQNFYNKPLPRLMGGRTNLVGLRKDGVEIPVEISLGLIEISNGQLLATNIRDISDRLAVEENLRLVRREASIQQEQLARLIRIQTLGEMASGIAHEVNQPLAAIQSYAEAAKRYLPPHDSNLEKAVELLEKVNKQALRAGSIVNHLRSMMQQQGVEFEPADINTIIGQMIKLAEIDTANNDYRMILKFSRSLPKVICNVVQIQQVVLNLIRNAIEAMSELAVEADKMITIETKQLDAGHIEISVEDCGSGFVIEDQEMLFDAFFTTKDSGMGMGLSICRSIINTHGGEIEASAGARGGALFKFSLPVDTSSAELEADS